MLQTLSLLFPLLAPHSIEVTSDLDPRELYDVTAYDLEWAVVPDDQRLEGRVVVHATVTGTDVARITLDMADELELLDARTAGGDALPFERGEHLVHLALPEPVGAGSELDLELRYRGNPRAKDSFSGFHWAASADGCRVRLQTRAESMK